MKPNLAESTGHTEAQCLLPLEPLSFANHSTAHHQTQDVTPPPHPTLALPPLPPTPSPLYCSTNMSPLCPPLPVLPPRPTLPTLALDHALPSVYYSPANSRLQRHRALPIAPSCPTCCAEGSSRVSPSACAASSTTPPSLPVLQHSRVQHAGPPMCPLLPAHQSHPSNIGPGPPPAPHTATPLCRQDPPSVLPHGPLCATLVPAHLALQAFL